MNFANAISRCDDSGVKTQIKRIEQYKEYSFLCEMTSSEYKVFRDMFKTIPLQVRAWYKFANGGFLFDTQFLSTKFTLPRIKLPLLSVYNGSTAREYTKLPNRYAVFAIASFGDHYCFSQEGDPEIIQWSVVEHKCVARWSNFYLWLKQELDASEEMAMDDVLLPLGLYAEMEGPV